MCVQEKLKIPLKASVKMWAKFVWQKLNNLLVLITGFPKSYKKLKSNDWKKV